MKVEYVFLLKREEHCHFSLISILLLPRFTFHLKTRLKFQNFNYLASVWNTTNFSFVTDMFRISVIFIWIFLQLGYTIDYKVSVLIVSEPNQETFKELKVSVTVSFEIFTLKTYKLGIIEEAPNF